MPAKYYCCSIVSRTDLLVVAGTYRLQNAILLLLLFNPSRPLCYYALTRDDIITHIIIILLRIICTALTTCDGESIVLERLRNTVTGLRK